MIGLLKQTGAAERLRPTLSAAILRSLARSVDTLGMALYNPDSVGGWPGGRAWINPGTYFARANWVEQLLNLQLAGQPVAGVPGLVAAAGWQTPATVVDGLSALAFEAPAPPDLRASLLAYLGPDLRPARLYGVARLLFSSPRYQLN